jgi:hypothetical protein
MEEKVFFQSISVHDLAADREFLRYARLTNVRQIVLHLIACVLLCIFVWFTSVLGNGWALILYCGIFITSHFITWLQLRKGSARYQQSIVLNHGVPITNIISCTDTCIRSVNPNTRNSHTYDYHHVLRISETKYFLILVCKANLCVVVDKHNLTGGTIEEFIGFLQSRCPNLNKKIHRDTAAKIFAILYAAVLAVVLLIGISRLPLFADLSARISGRISDSASYTEIAAELEELGITGIDDDLIETLEQYDNGYYFNAAYYKTLNLLSWVGVGEYDEEGRNWSPSRNGVYWFDAEVFDIEYMYTNFLEGVSSLDRELNFENIKEYTQHKDHMNNARIRTITFDWKDKNYILQGNVYSDWFDFQVAEDLNDIIKNSNTGRQLYFTPDGGQGVLIFYRDAQWAMEFQRKTGIELSTDPNSVW